MVVVYPRYVYDLAFGVQSVGGAWPVCTRRQTDGQPWLDVLTTGQLEPPMGRRLGQASYAGDARLVAGLGFLYVLRAVASWEVEAVSVRATYRTKGRGQSGNTSVRTTPPVEGESMRVCMVRAKDQSTHGDVVFHRTSAATRRQLPR